ncbi:MAG TPA: hypothetical protein VIL48_06310 [Acidimicrobiales bacterium]
MDDLERQLRAVVTRRGDELTPAPDLPDRIHARVARHRRRHRRRVAALAVALVAAVGGAGGLLARSAGPDDTVTAGSGLATRTTEPPRPPAEPDQRGDEPRPLVSDPGTGRPATAEPDEPPVTAATAGDPAGSEPAPETTTTTEGEPAEPGTGPAAGACAPADGSVAVFTLHPDVPAPRCAQVEPDQGVRIENATDQPVDVAIGPHAATVPPGGGQSFGQPVGEYLAPGTHRVTTSLYGGSGPELVVVR